MWVLIPRAAISLLLIGCFVAAKASAVPITFSETAFAIVVPFPNVTLTTEVVLTDLANPDPNVASFEILLKGTVENYSSEAPSGVGIEDQYFEFFDGMSVDFGLSHGSFLDGDLTYSGLAEALYPPFLYLYDGQAGLQVHFPVSVPGGFPDGFVEILEWSALVVVSMEVTQPEDRLSLGTYYSRAGGPCLYDDGVLLNCDIGGGGLNDGPGHAVTLVTAIPEPSTGLLFGFGLGVVGRMTWKKRTH